MQLKSNTAIGATKFGVKIIAKEEHRKFENKPDIFFFFLQLIGTYFLPAEKLA